ncbi:unnamed protein product [Prorocentrum cordatum]|uniref:Reverse transcriptase domain-containing protein n=1 Tax=Prorocentrum cordatum TaxID=2364126 RepID=A0ABN9T1B8_9DINO|nr:unnamed protein product [Polarella glacialis]
MPMLTVRSPATGYPRFDDDEDQQVRTVALCAIFAATELPMHEDGCPRDISEEPDVELVGQHDVDDITTALSRLPSLKSAPALKWTINLIGHVGKAFANVVIMPELRAMSGWLSATQFGTLHGRSTRDAIALVDEIGRRFPENPCRTKTNYRILVAALIDLEKAFDLLTRSAVRPPVQVFWNSVVFMAIELRLLDAPQVKFVDDLIARTVVGDLATVSEFPEFLGTNVNANGLTMNAPKTELMVSVAGKGCRTVRRKISTKQIGISLTHAGGQVRAIHPTPTVKYLGCLLSAKGSCSAEVKARLTSANQAHGQLIQKVLAGNLSARLKIRLWNSLARPSSRTKLRATNSAKLETPMKHIASSAQTVEKDVMARKVGISKGDKLVTKLLLQREDNFRGSARDKNAVVKLKTGSQMQLALAAGIQNYQKVGRDARAAVEPIEHRGHPHGKKPDAYLRILLFRLSEAIEGRIEDVLAAVAQGPHPAESKEALRLAVEFGKSLNDKEAKLKATRCFDVQTKTDVDGKTVEETKWSKAAKELERTVFKGGGGGGTKAPCESARSVLCSTLWTRGGVEGLDREEALESIGVASERFKAASRLFQPGGFRLGPDPRTPASRAGVGGRRTPDGDPFGSAWREEDSEADEQARQSRAKEEEYRRTAEMEANVVGARARELLEKVESELAEAQQESERRIVLRRLVRELHPDVNQDRQEEVMPAFTFVQGLRELAADS